VDDRPLSVTDPALSAKLGSLRFYSATYRLFKLEGLEDACEDHGQAVIYRGSIPHLPHGFMLDKHHAIETGRVFPVCGNTFRMLHDTRFASHFQFVGDFSQHFGLFEGCGSSIPFDANANTASAGASGGCC
jgi:hypothetical protein